MGNLKALGIAVLRARTNPVLSVLGIAGPTMPDGEILHDEYLVTEKLAGYTPPSQLVLEAVGRSLHRSPWRSAKSVC
jgi:hypothetical protein